jgi:hypothetical protein
VVGALVIAIGLAIGEPIAVALDYHAPPSCPDQAAFLAQLERDLGAPVIVDPSADHRVHVTVHDASDRGYRLVFSAGLLDDGAPIELADAECDALVRVAALRTSLVLTPTPRDEVPPATCPAAPACPTIDSPAVAPVRSSPPPPPSPPRAWLRAMGGVEGFGAGLHGLTGAAAMVRVGPIGVEMRGMWAAPTSYALSEDRRAGVRVQAGWIAASVCLRAPRRRLALGVCGGLEGGAVRTRGFGIAAPQTRHAMWLALPVRAGLIVALPRRIGLFAELEGAPLLIRPGARVRGLPLAYRAGPVSARALIGVELRLGEAGGESRGGIRTRTQ